MPHLVRTGEPSAEELAEAHKARFTAAIGLNLGPPPPDLLQRLVDIYGASLDARDVFLFPSQLSNSLIDFYWTYMTKPTLDQYAVDAETGRALMIAHDYMTMPIGYSYAGRVEQDTSDPLDALPTGSGPDHIGELVARNGGARTAPAPTDPVWRLYTEWYMIRGLSLSTVPNDQVIRAVETQTWRDMSIGFNCDTMRCDLCHMDIMSWDCPHLPGASYEVGPGQLERCIAAVEGGTMLEGSFGYKGATPDAAVVPVKARLIAAGGRLNQEEARVILALEARLGQRLIDPRDISRAYTTVHVVGAAKEKNMPLPQKKSGTTQRSAGKRQDAGATPPPAPEDGNAASSGDVADLSTITAEQLAADIARIDEEIATTQGQIAALQTQIDAPPPTDSTGAPVDMTEQIAGWTAEQATLQQHIDELTADREEAQALLDQANAVASNAGGSPAEAPAPTDPAAAAAGTTQGAAMVSAALRSMLNTARTHLYPGRGRRLTAEEAQPIIDLANQLLTAVQGLVTDAAAATGTQANVARTVADQAIFAVLQRDAAARDVKHIGVAYMSRLTKDAEAGRMYREDLIKTAIAEQTRALGAAATDPDVYRRMLADLPIADLKKEAERYAKAANGMFDGGRRVVPESLQARLERPEPADADQEDEAEPTLTGRVDPKRGSIKASTNGRR